MEKCLPIKSYQNEFSHVFVVLPILFTTENMYVKFGIFIIILYHLHRYIKYRKIAILHTKKQLNLRQISITLAIYAMIIWHIFNMKYTVPLAIISTILLFIGLYHNYNEFPACFFPIFPDLYASFFYCYLLIQTSNPHIKFFAIKYIFEHILEYIIVLNKK